MSFDNRTEFKSAASSEKITLAHIEAKKRLYVFNGPTSNVYDKVVPYFVVGLKQDDIDLTEAADQESVTSGTWFYDIRTSTLYVNPIGGLSPDQTELIVTYRFFYSSKSLTTTHNLQDIADEVYYDGRLTGNPFYKHKIGIDQSLTSLVGEGNMALKNHDAGLDEIFDSLVFENQAVTIYSWNQSLNPSDARIIYRGVVTNKTYNGERITFKIKDQIFALLDAPNIEAYTASDRVGESARGQYKRRVYGRVDGLRAQSVDQIGSGLELSGVVTAEANSDQLIGSGTSFFNEVLQGDTLLIDTQEFTVDEVISDTEIRLSDETEFGFASQSVLLTTERGTTLANRRFLATGHICAEVTHQVVNFQQFNRVQLSSTEGLFAGDFVEFQDTGERIEIKNTAPGNILVLRQNVVTKAGVGTNVIRRPIQEVFIGSRRVNADDYSIFNTGNECGLVFQTDAEFNLARARNTVFDATFTIGSRTVSVSTNEVALDEVFRPGDFVKPDNITYTTFYKVTNVNDTTLTLSTAFIDATITDTVELKSPDYINDDTVISVNILGKTEDGTATGAWISTAAQAQKDIISDVGLTDVNQQSFLDGQADLTQLIGIAIPESFKSKTLPTVKDIVDKLNKTVNASLTLDNDLKIKFQGLNVYSGEDLPEFKDSDAIDWRIKSTNGKTYRTVQNRYRFVDVDLASLEAGNSIFTFESEFVRRYIGTTKNREIDSYLYTDLDAEIASHRFLYYNRLGQATLTIDTDLRLEDIEIGDIVIADFERIYRRFGDPNVRKKMMSVIGKELSGERTKLILNDFGNTFNTSTFITPNDAPDYSTASDDEKLRHGYITDNQGIVDNEEETAGTNLIS